MKIQIRRTLLLLFIAIITAAAAVMIIMTTTVSDRDAEIAAASPQDAQLAALAVENGGIKQVSAVGSHTMVLFNNGKLYGTGYNGYGQLGVGDTTSRKVFTLVKSLSDKNIVSVSCGYNFTMAITSAGELYATGQNDYGQLGLGNTAFQTTFQQVKGISKITSVTASYFHTMAITSAGELYGTGMNVHGQLGLGNTVSQTTFQLLPNVPTGITSVACGQYHTMALTANGQLYATGSNSVGQLGLNGSSQNSFQLVSSVPTGITSVACGSGHTMVIANGQLYATGSNSVGQLGLGDNINRSIFQQVIDFPTNDAITSVTCGSNHTMVIANGQLYATGSNNQYQLGLGNLIGAQTSFQHVTAFADKQIMSVACGSDYSLVVLGDGQLYGFGYNGYGALGLGTGTYVYVVTKVPLNYTINYDGNGGKLMDGATSSQDIQYDISTPLQDNPFVLDGCMFVGWAISSGSSSMIYKDKAAVQYLAEIRESKTLYAIWQPDAPKISLDASLNEMAYDGTSEIELTANYTGYSKLTYTYRWLYKGEDATTFSTVSGATGKTLKLKNVKQSGTYKVEVIARYQNKSATSTSGEQQIKISKANVSPTLSIEDWTYGTQSDKVPKPQIANNIGGGAVTYYYEGTPYGEEEGSYKSTTTAPAQAGEYTLSVKIAATDNTYSYETTSGEEAAFTINRAERKPTVKFPEGLKYTGSAIAAPYVTDVFENPDITLSYSGTSNGGKLYDSDTPPTDAGTYTVTVDISETNNYKAMSYTQEFTIARAKPDVKISINNWTYGNEPNAPVISGNYEYIEEVICTYSGTSNGGTEYPDLSEAPTEAGKYTVRAHLDAKDNYEEVDVKQVFDILRKSQGVPNVSLKGWKYGEAPDAIAPVVEGNESGGEVSYSYEVKNNDVFVEYADDIAKAPAGTYRITAVIGQTGNYNSVSSSGYVFTIEKGTQAPTVTLRDRWTYGDTLANPDVKEVKDGAAVSYEYSGTPYKNETFVTGSTPPTLAGDYKVKITIAETANYGKYTVDHEFTIDRQVVYAPWIESKQYTGAKLTAAVTALSGVYKVTQNNGGTMSGSYPVELTLEDPSNYTWEEGQAGISGAQNEKLLLMFYITGAVNRWTDGPFIGAIGANNNVTYGDEITYTAVAAKGNVAVTYWNTDGTKIAGKPTQVGTYKAKFTVEATAEYAGLSEYVTFNITTRNVTVKIANKSSVYNMPFAELTYSVEGLAYDDTAEDLNVKLTKASGETAKEYAITGTWNNGNYAVTFKNGTYTIEKATYNMDGVQFNDVTVTYNGYDRHILVTGELPDGVTVTYTPSNCKREAGTYTITAQFKGDANYNDIEDMTAELTIEKADYDMSGVTFKDTEITYDGKAHTLVVTGTLPSGLDGTPVTVTYSSDGNGTVTDVADGTVTITATYATQSKNYNVPAAQTATLKIVAKELTEDMFVVGGGSYIFNGDPKEPTLTARESEPGLADSYKYEYGDNVNAGDGTITVTGSGNYSGSIVLTFKIEKGKFTPKVTIEGWKYNEKAKTPVVGDNTSGGECTFIYSGASSDGTRYESSKAPVKAGDYSVIVKVAETKNYEAAASSSVKFVIERGVIKPKITIANWTYGDDPSVPVLIGNDGNGKVTLTYTGKGYDGITYREQYGEVSALRANFGAGDAYTLEVVIAETDDYAAATIRVNFEIYRRKISVPEIKPVISNGYLQKADISATEDYKVSTNDGGYGGSEYAVVLTLADPANTEWSEGDVSGANNKDLNLKFRIIGNANSWPTVPSVTNVTYGEEVNPDYASMYGEVTVTYYDKDGTLLEGAPTAAGHYTAKFTVEGTIDYTGLEEYVEFDILPKEVTVTIDEKGHVYGETEEKLTWNAAEGSVIEGDELNVTLFREQGTNAGKYAIKGTWNNGNYNVRFAGGVYTITKAKYDMDNVSFAGDKVTYDGKVHSLEVTGLPKGVSVTYTNNDQKNAGEYEVTATFKASDTTNYEVLETSELTAVLNIEKAKYNTDGIKFAGKTVTYNGETHSLIVEGLPAGVSVGYVGNDRKNAGTYEVTATFTGDANHEAIVDMKATLKIAKAKYVMSGVEFADKKVTYDGKEHRIEVTGLPAGVSVTYTNNGQTNAGEYEVTATFEGADTENYEALETSELTAVLNIEKAKYNTDDLKFAGKTVTYNGETHSLYVEGLPGDVSVTYIGNDKRNAGEYEVTAVFTGDANYETIGKMSATLKIGKAKYDVSGVEFAGKEVTYNGETHSLYVDGLPAGVSVKYVGNDKRNAGTYEVTAVFTVDENHEAIATKSATLTINKAKYQVPAFADMTVTYDGESHSLKVSGVPYGVTVEYEGNGKKEAGTYTVTAKFTGDANYEALGDLTATLTIVEKGGCGSVVVDGATIAGIGVSVLAFATYLAIRRAKSKKK